MPIYEYIGTQNLENLRQILLTYLLNTDHIEHLK